MLNSPPSPSSPLYATTPSDNKRISSSWTIQQQHEHEQKSGLGAINNNNTNNNNTTIVGSSSSSSSNASSWNGLSGFQKFKYYLKKPLHQSSKCITIMNVLLILFILQGLFGLFSSFILLYTTGDNLIVQSRANQKLQMKSVIDYEIGEMVKSTTLIMNQLLYQINSGGPFDLNNNLTWFRIFYYLKRLYVHKSPLRMLYFGRFDQSFIGVEVDFVRLLLKATDPNDLTRLGTDYYLISDPQMIYSGMNIIESKNWTLKVTDRAWYSMFNTYQSSNKTLSNVKWSPLFANVNKQPSITLSMPIYINIPTRFLPTQYTQMRIIPYFQSSLANNYTLNNSSFITLNRYLTMKSSTSNSNNGNSDFSDPIISNLYNQVDVSEYLYGVIGIQLSLDDLASRLNQSTIEAGVALTLIINSNSDIVACTDLDYTNIGLTLSTLSHKLYGPSSTSAVNTNLANFIIHSILNHSISNYDFLKQIEKSTSTSSTSSSSSSTSGKTVGGINIKDLTSYTYQNGHINLDISLHIITDSYGLSWGALIAVQQKTFVEQVISTSLSSVLIFVSVIVVGTFALFTLVQSVQIPLRGVKKQLLDLVELTNLNERRNVFSLFNDIRQMQQSMNIMKRGIKIFSKYVPELVVKRLNNLNSMTNQNMSVMFTNIQDFTKLNEQVNELTFLQMTSDYFTIISNLIEQCNGIIDKFNGDSILAMFNDQSQPNLNHEHSICNCALQCLQSINVLNLQFNTCQYPSIHLNLGLNSGDMLCGNIYSHSRINFTVLGDNVNSACRLQYLNVKYGSRILLGENTFEKVKMDFICYFIDFIVLKGKSDPIRIYSLESNRTNASTRQVQSMNSCMELEMYYFQFKFNDCLQVLDHLEDLLFKEHYIEDNNDTTIGNNDDNTTTNMKQFINHWRIKCNKKQMELDNTIGISSTGDVDDDGPIQLYDYEE